METRLLYERLFWTIHINMQFCVIILLISSPCLTRNTSLYLCLYLSLVSPSPPSCLSFCPSICLSVSLSLLLCIYQFVCHLLQLNYCSILTVSLSVYLYYFLSVTLLKIYSDIQSVYLTVCRFNCMPCYLIFLSVFLSYLSVCLSVSFWLSLSFYHFS